jgi:hypothetical protein
MRIEAEKAADWSVELRALTNLGQSKERQREGD